MTPTLDDIQRLASQLASNPDDEDLRGRLQRVLERAASSDVKPEARWTVAHEALRWAEAVRGAELVEQGGLNTNVREAVAILDRARFRRDAEQLFDVWLGRTEPWAGTSWGYFPEVLPEHEREEVARLWSLVEIEKVRAKQVDLGNFWPRETDVVFTFRVESRYVVKYNYIGPFWRDGEPNVTLEVDNAYVIDRVMDDTTYTPAPLKLLQDSLETSLDMRSLLRFVLMVGESRRFNFDGGAAAVDEVLRGVGNA